ncbi:hypothetical protein G6F63_014821 [Rhizopus arrhizus]|nr:hypothetical protein G6F35_016321 [Rhizopus arrhizus]KAG1319268.1 hypothetical protein G6F63_014821 [Rhizopus arrhizus]
MDRAHHPRRQRGLQRRQRLPVQYAVVQAVGRQRVGLGDGARQSGFGAHTVDPAVAAEQVRDLGVVLQGIMLGHAALDQRQHRVGRAG